MYIYGKFEVSHGIPHEWTTPCQLEPWRAMARPTGAMVPAAKKAVLCNETKACQPDIVDQNFCCFMISVFIRQEKDWHWIEK